MLKNRGERDVRGVGDSGGSSTARDTPVQAIGRLDRLLDLSGRASLTEEETEEFYRLQEES